MNTFCQILTNNLAEQNKFIEELQRLVDDFTVVPTPEKQAAIQREMDELTQVHEKFLNEYKEKAQNLIITWLRKHSTQPKDILEVGENGMVTVKVSVLLSSVEDYWPILIEKVEGDVDFNRDSSSLKNTRSIGGEFAIQLIDFFAADYLSQVGRLRVVGVKKIHFPLLHKILGEAVIQVTESTVFPSLTEIGKFLRLTDSKKTQPKFRDAFPVLELIGRSPMTGVSISASSDQLAEEIKNDPNLHLDGQVIVG